MTESDIVNSVLIKRADDALKEVLLSYGVGHLMEKVWCELSWIKFFIWDTDSIGDESRRNWENRFKDVAYQLDDWIKTFKSKDEDVREIQSRGQICSGKMERMFRKPKKFLLPDDLRDKINRIHNIVQGISQEIKAIKSLSDPNRSGMRMPPKKISVQPQHVFGFEEHVDNIQKVLLDKNTTRRSVISIVGMGGIGKTTLAKLVYHSEYVKGHFDLRIWVAVPSIFKVIDLLRKMMSHIQPHDLREKNQKECMYELRQSLSGKRYLIVLDDVWLMDLWVQIEAALPDNNIGSRVLMTTRISEVAKMANHASEPYLLSHLNVDLSLELLLSKALPPYEGSDHLLPDDLLSIAKQCVMKCSGVPLALVVMGGLLFKREPTYSSWIETLQTMEQGSSSFHGLGNVILLGYDSLPINLKKCFMYFASFPEDYEIDAKRLTRIWIAEGLIPFEENRTWEDIANSFLESLVERSMIEVSLRSPDGTILACRMHDLLLELAIQKAKESKFLVVFSDTNEQISAGARRMAFHNSNGNEVIRYADPNLHSLLLINSQIPNCSRHRLLKVLMSVSSNTDAEINFQMSKELRYLNYFELTGQISTNSKKYFKILLGSMKILQTLDLRRVSGCGDLPDSVWHVKTLRHVMLPPYTSGPPSSADLSNLQTLTGVKARASWDAKTFPNLPSILDLDILIEQGFPIGVFRSILSTLQCLLSLKIVGTDLLMILADCREYPFYPHLQSLSLESLLITNYPVMLRTSMFPSQITELELENLQLREDPMSVLKEIEPLKVLKLRDKTYMGRTMGCLAGSFFQLEELIFVGLEMLEEWEIEEGTMPRLEQLRVQRCPQLQVPLGLQYLSSLKIVYWKMDLEIESERIKANVIRSICKHVPSVVVENN